MPQYQKRFGRKFFEVRIPAIHRVTEMNENIEWNSTQKNNRHVKKWKRSVYIVGKPTTKKESLLFVCCFCNAIGHNSWSHNWQEFRLRDVTQQVYFNDRYGLRYPRHQILFSFSISRYISINVYNWRVQCAFIPIAFLLHVCFDVCTKSNNLWLIITDKYQVETKNMCTVF